MTALYRRYALVDENSFNRLTTAKTHARNPFQNTTVASTKKIGNELNEVLADGLDDATTKQMMFSSKLREYRDSVDKSRGRGQKRRRDENENKKRSRKKTMETAEGTELLLNLSPPRTSHILDEPFRQTRAPVLTASGLSERGDETTSPARQQRRPAERFVEGVTSNSPGERLLASLSERLSERTSERELGRTLDAFGPDDAERIMGGVLLSDQRRAASRLLNQAYKHGLVNENGRFRSFTADGQKITSTSIRDTIRRVATNAPGHSTAFTRTLKALRELGFNPRRNVD